MLCSYAPVQSPLQVVCVVFLHLLVSGIQGHAGTEFFLALPQNDQSNTASFITLTPEDATAASITVQIRGGNPSQGEVVDKTLQLANGTASRYHLPVSMPMPLGCVVITGHALLVTSSGPINIVVWSEGKSNSEAYLALPVTQLGTDYFVFAYPGSAGEKPPAAGFLLVTGVSPDTQLTIQLPQISVPENEFVFFQGKYYGPGDVISATLNEADVLQIQSIFDLTGTHVKGSSPIGVWSGVNRTAHQSQCRSHMVETSPPTQTFGREFVLLVLPYTLPSEEFRVLSRGWSTQVTVNTDNGVSPTVHYLPRPGSYVRISATNLSTYMSLTADKDVAVTRIIPDGSEDADFSMTTILPTDKATNKEYRFGWYDHHNNEEVLLSYAIRSSDKATLQLNGHPLVTTKGPFWSNIREFPVVNWPDWMVALVSVNVTSDLVEYELKQTNGLPFTAYASAAKKCEAEGYPLGYPDVASMSDSPDLPEVPVSGQCCHDTDLTGNTMVDLHCPITWPPGEQCCVNNNVYKTCTIQNMETSCQRLSRYRLSDSPETVSASTVLECYTTCRTSSGCYGINYSETDDVNTRCELLMGTPGGFITNGSWLYSVCSSKMSLLLV